MPDAPSRRLLDAARTADGLAAWRAEALAVLVGVVSFDRALFHELSPRVPLDRAAVVGFDLEALAEDRPAWDDHAVQLGRLRDLALAGRGVATDRDAFPPRSAARRRWFERVGRPLGIGSLLAAHLVVQGRVVSVVLLGRSRPDPFTAEEQGGVEELVPPLAVADALLQGTEAAPVRGPATDLRCLDQRLTPRQREVVVHVALGHTNAAIGRALGISSHTVRNHLAAVCERLGAANRAEVVRLAVMQ